MKQIPNKRNGGKRVKKVKVRAPSRSRSVDNSVTKLSNTVKELSNVVKSKDRVADALGGAGGFLFGERGRSFGKAIGHAFTGITGIGDYKVSRNSILSSGKSIADMKKTGQGIVIKHREYLCDISGSSAFSRLDFELNPGLASTFPWLSQVAAYFEEYDFEGVVFEYRPSSGMVTATNPSLGMIVAASEYNVTSDPFQTKVQAESAMFATSTVPYEPMVHPIECAGTLTNKLLVRSGTVSDKKWYDLARTSIVTQGMPSAYVCGELWISYVVRLSKPRINACLPGDWFSLDGSFGSGSWTPAAAYVGTSRFGSVSGLTGEMRLYLPRAGRYRVSMTMDISGGTWTASNLAISYSNINAYGATGYAPNPAVSAFELQTKSNVCGRATTTANYTFVAGNRWEATVEVPTDGTNNYVSIIGFDGITASTIKFLFECLTPKAAVILPF